VGNALETDCIPNEPGQAKVEVEAILPFPKKQWRKTFGPAKLIRLPLMTGALYSVEVFK